MSEVKCNTCDQIGGEDDLNTTCRHCGRGIFKATSGERSEWELKFPPARYLPPSDEYDHDPEEGCQLGLYGKSDTDRGVVFNVDENLVWTILAVDGKCYACPGFHTVNWLCYYISEVARTGDELDEYLLDW